MQVYFGSHFLPHSGHGASRDRPRSNVLWDCISLIDRAATQFPQLAPRLRDEQGEPLSRRQVILVAEVRDGNALDQLHHEVRSARGRGTAIEHLGNAGVIHDRQGLSLGLEASDNLP